MGGPAWGPGEFSPPCIPNLTSPNLRQGPNPSRAEHPRKSSEIGGYDTLLGVTADGWKLQPRLAESWEPSADLLLWRFILRKGVTFHDGRPLEAKDVVWTFRRTLDKNVGSLSFPRFSRTMTAEGITAPGPMLWPALGVVII